MKILVLRSFTLLGVLCSLLLFQNCSTYDGADPVEAAKKETTTLTPTTQYCAADVSGSGSACQNKGAGVIVTLTGLPSDIQNKMNNCRISVGWFGASGNGLNVEWGDGERTPDYSEATRGSSCSSLVSSHKFPGPGVYSIRIVSWHPGPTDAPITDWQKTITVVINN